MYILVWTAKIRQALDELARSSHRNTSTSLVGPLGFLSSRKHLMFQLLHPITSWLLIAVVLTGQLPALIHKVECVHSCAVVQANVDDSFGLETPSSSPCCDKSCCNSALDGTPEVVTPTVGNLSVQSEHACDDCTICQSLLSTNGLVGLSDRPVGSELLQVELLAAEQVAPELNRFGISQSRAPPGCSA